MKHRKLAASSVLLALSFVPFRFNGISLPETEKRISHAYVGDDSASLEKLKEGNTDSVHYTSYFQSYYFSNLKQNFANNTFGTCTYVSMGMLFSFFDTYYDDGFVPAQFERDTRITAKDGEESFALTHDAPGIGREPDALVAGISEEDYGTLIDKEAENYFQFKLLSLAKQKFGKVALDRSSFGMTHDEMIRFMEYYLYDYRGYEEPEVTIKTASENKSSIISFVENEMRNGNPVILRTSDFGGHSFVVYDYDETTKEYYAHTGLSGQDTVFSHYRLGKLDNLGLWDATSLSVNTMHVHTGHYILDSGTKETKVCPCSYMKPRDISVKGDRYRDSGAPTFSWKSLIRDKWYRNYGPYFEAEILDSGKNRILRFPNLRTFSVTLTESQWKEAVTHETGNLYYFRVKVWTSGVSQSDEWVETKEFRKPRSFLSLYSVSPSKYGFGDSYPTDDKTKTEFTEHSAGSGLFRFQTRRYRTGYIHGECLVMSPIRKGIDEAFLEYRFDTAINGMEVELSHWREVETELLTKDNGKAVIQCFRDREWVDVFDLLSSSANLGHDRNNMQVYRIDFERPAYRIRFYSRYYGTATNESNRGRICIGNMKVEQSEYSMPLSGSELDYDPEYWNTKTIINDEGKVEKLIDVTNCYSYALNAEKNYENQYRTMLPGLDVLSHEYIMEKHATIDQIRTDLKSDSQKYGFTLNEVSGTERCQPGTYKIACFIEPKTDFHFYRQNSDGTWSHKPGPWVKVINTDESGNIIMDPLKCNRKSPNSQRNYSTFVAYYEVTPRAV